MQALCDVQDGTLTDVEDHTRVAASEIAAACWPGQSQLSAAAVVAFAQDCRHAIIASTRADGRPHAVPGDFVLVDAQLWLPTDKGALRRRNVAGQPWLSVVACSDEADRHTVLIVEGPARDVAMAAAPAEVTGQYHTKYGRGPLALGCWLVVTAQRVFSYGGPRA